LDGIVAPRSATNLRLVAPLPQFPFLDVIFGLADAKMQIEAMGQPGAN
jgi:hypothetical protein